MPRGGRRPGAGAPNGNVNAARGASPSLAAAATILRLLEEFGDNDTLREIGRALYEEGYFPPPHHRFNGDPRGAAHYIYRRLLFGPPFGRWATTMAAPSAGPRLAGGPDADTPFPMQTTPHNQTTVRPAEPSDPTTPPPPREGRPQ
jgi:hypothetical protein